MSNLFDYMDWRGDLTVKQDPLNEIDGLVLSRLSYLPFDGIVSPAIGEWMTIGQAAQKFRQTGDPSAKVFLEEDNHLLSAMEESERFRNMSLSGYVNQIDYRAEKQFSAVVIKVSEDLFFISYRGTDNTLVGWKEDFNMGFMTPVPAQKDAVDYLERAASVLYGELMTGGHSKGGNLAVYAAAFCSDAVRRRITGVYNNDGPGFDENIIKMPGYSAICQRIHTFVPQSSVVGMLLEHEEKYTIIHSTQKGILQHDIYSWEAVRNHFVCLDTITNGSKFIDKTLKGWVADMSRERREQFFDSLFTILEATNAKTVKELTSNWYESALAILKSLKNMDEPMRQMISQTLSLLLKSAKENIPIMLPKLPGPAFGLRK